MTRFTRLALLAVVASTGCRYEPETPLEQAVARGGVTALGNAAGGGGFFDITDGPGLGVCHPETARLLLARAPDLRPEGGRRTRLHFFVSWLARGRGCDEVRAMLDPRHS